MEEFRYTKIFLESVLQNVYTEIRSRDDGKALFTRKSDEYDRIKLSESQLQAIVSQKHGIFLVPLEKEKFYRPNTEIKNMKEFEEALSQYLNALSNCGKNFYRIDEEHGIYSYFYYLVKTLTNSDNTDLSKYINVFNGFLNDHKFSKLKTEGKIGRIELGSEETEKYDVLAKRAEEYYGAETPYTMRFFLDRKGFKYTMPFVRYGISGEQAYIYSIQRKGKIKLKYPRIKEIHVKFNKVNSGIKSERDITPSMLISATMFIGMLKGAGIEEVKIADFLTRRYGHYNGVSSYEEADRIQENTTNKFLRIFTRIQGQFDGIDIYSYPNDVDSYLTIKLEDTISSPNHLLNEFFNLGFEYGKIENNIER